MEDKFKMMGSIQKHTSPISKCKGHVLASGMILLSALGLYAVPAYRGLQEVKQKDGTIVTIMKVGDENRHVILSKDGALLTYGEKGIEYARIGSAGQVETTGIQAINPESRPKDHIKYLTIVGDNYPALLSGTKEKPSASSMKNIPGRFPDSKFPTEGSPKVLVILAEYTDVKFTLPDPLGYFSGMLNETGFSQYEGTGCAKEYFEQNSDGKYIPQFDVFGPVTLPKAMAYYGGNDDLNHHEMVVDACRLLDTQIDFSQYDNDGDKYVDNVFIIYAGQGENAYGGADTVWPQAGELIGRQVFETLDQTILNRYACCNEWLQNRPDGVGTFIHEFSHVMGLPDLYSTSGGRLSATPGSWSVLDYGPYNNGGCTPPNYSAFERCAMGWLTPSILDGTATNLRLEEIGSNQAAMIPVTPNGKEYFLLENRQQTGWDTYLPGHGMLVWHVDYDDSVWIANSPNNDPNHQRVDIIEAGGIVGLDNKAAMASYPFPGTKGVTSLGYGTTPRLCAWDGSDTGIFLDEISENENGVVRCFVNGGVEVISVPEWNRLNWDESGIDIGWNAVEGAEYYELEVNAIYEGEAGTDLNNMGKGSMLGLPDGWTSSSTSTFTTSGNYGESAPSYKMDEDGSYMESPEYPSDVQKVSFWMKGMQNSGSMLKLLGYKNGEWILLQEYEPKDNVKKTETLEVVAGVNRIRFEYSMSKGRVALDDILVTYGNESHALDGYNPKKVGNTTERVECGDYNANKYSCRVRAVAGEEKSFWSEVRTIDLKSPDSEVGTINTIAGVKVDGRKVTAGCDVLIEAFDMLGRKRACGCGEIELPEAGAYIVKAGSDIMKTICR